MDYTALEQAVLKELQRQGVEYARVKMYLNYGTGEEHHLVIEAMTEEQIQPKYVEAMRVANQIKGRSKPRPLLED